MMMRRTDRLTDVHQRLADEKFILMVAWLVDLDTLAGRILAAHGGWDD